ncbi:MAG: MBL fold metallo-hydrolase [Treponema sp.]|nr:MBL fold metallo-hydrolase [Treponema sp.]
MRKFWQPAHRALLHQKTFSKAKAMNLHLLRTGPLGVNTYLVPVSKTDVIVIDPADCTFSHDEGSVVSYLASKNLVPVAVVLTHGHFDHVSGLPFLKKSFPALPIAIHPDDAAYVGADSAVMQGKALAQMGFDEFLPFVTNLPQATAFLEDKKTLADVFASVSFSEEVRASLSQWEILHTPGHTEGSCCLYNDAERTLISGDTMFYRSWGRTDLVGGNERKIHQSLLKINEYCEEDTRVYSGHDGGSFILGENF